jgi:cytochrome c-type biogenesis protein CcmH/NrfG
MSTGARTPEPDPRRASLESIEAQLQALPAPEVPEGLAAKLILSISTPSAAAVAAAGINKAWFYFVGIVAAGAVAAVIFSSLSTKNDAPRAADADAMQKSPKPTATELTLPGKSKSSREAERAVPVDPYNADAWFSLAKVQASEGKATEAISSARKALDIARSGKRPELVTPIETWLREHGDLPQPPR